MQMQRVSPRIMCVSYIYYVCVHPQPVIDGAEDIEMAAEEPEESGKFFIDHFEDTSPDTVCYSHTLRQFMIHFYRNE